MRKESNKPSTGWGYKREKVRFPMRVYDREKKLFSLPEPKQMINYCIYSLKLYICRNHNMMIFPSSYLIFKIYKISVRTFCGLRITVI